MLKSLFGAFGGRRLDESLLEDWEETLVMSDVSLDTTDHLIKKVREAARRGQAGDSETAQAVLRQSVEAIFTGVETDTSSTTDIKTTDLVFAPTGQLTVWLFVGVNGVGKTTTIGKLAAQMVREGRKPLLVAGDTFRAAATEQLQIWGKRAGCDVVAQQQGADPAAVVFDGLSAARARGCDLVMIDTAGRLHTKGNLMNELAKIARIVERETGHAPHETLLVIDASTGQNGLTQARAFTGSAPLSGLILTKWDGTAKGGIVLTIAHETGLPVKLLGVGEQVDDLCGFDAKEWTNTLFGS